MSMSAPVETSVAHSRHMDRIHHRQRHICDQTRKYYLLGRDRAIRSREPPRDGTALEVGGTLTIVDFGDHRDLPGWFRTGLRKWLARFGVTPRDALIDWLVQSAGQLDLEVHPERLWRGYAMSVPRRSTRRENDLYDTRVSPGPAE